MPGHRTHDRVGLALTPVITAASLYVLPPLYTGVLVGSYMFATLYLSPDLDLKSRIYNRWSVLRFIWYPYRKIIHHRSWLSHSGPISATIRLFYLTVWLLPLLFISNIYAAINLQSIRMYVILWIAICLADTIHVLMDALYKD